jgi:glycosyltransferase involved in cell wall biosynthesis
MRVAIVTSTFDEVGGVEIFNNNIIRILREAGHSVSRITLECLDTRPEERERERVLGEYFNRLNKEEKYDVVICNGEFGYSVDHPKAINVFHGGYYGYAMAVKDLVPKEITQERIRKSEMQRIAAEGKYVVTVSNFAKKMLEDFGMGVDEAINLSIDTNIFYPNNSIRTLETSLAISRGKYYEKGFDVLKRLADKGIKMKLFSNLNIDIPNVEDMDLVDNQRLGKEYNQAKIFLNPTRFEGGGLTNLEAMACGCPLLTTPTGYGYDIRKEIPNFVAETFNEFMAKYLLVINEREKYSEKALDYFNQFHNPKDFESRWVSLVESI